MNRPNELTVFYDFLCPWAYRGAIWLQEVERAGRIRTEWKFFSLVENHRRRDGVDTVPVWERDGSAKGLPAFRAALAARAQGIEAYDRFRLALQKARHEQKMQVDELETHRHAAKVARLDPVRFEHDLKSAGLSTLAADHEEAVRRGVFGVPTLVWPEGRSYYVKITDLILPERAVQLYDAIESVHRFGELIEIKTPESEGTLVA